MTWQSEISFGQYEGVPLLEAWIKDKDYFAWLIRKGCDRPEIEFVKSEMTATERRRLQL